MTRPGRCADVPTLRATLRLGHTKAAQRLGIIVRHCRRDSAAGVIVSTASEPQSASRRKATRRRSCTVTACTSHCQSISPEKVRPSPITGVFARASVLQEESVGLLHDRYSMNHSGGGVMGPSRLRSCQLKRDRGKGLYKFREL